MKTDETLWVEIYEFLCGHIPSSTEDLGELADVLFRLIHQRPEPDR